MSEKFETMSRSELLQHIRRERSLLEKALADLTPAEMLLPGVAGAWSARDVLAHFSIWERRMLAWIGSHLRGEQPVVPLPWDIDRMNAAAWLETKGEPFADVLAEFHRSYKDALALVERLTEEQLQVNYTDTWPMGPLWLGVAANMNFHYKEHREDMEQWLAARRGR